MFVWRMPPNFTEAVVKGPLPSRLARFPGKPIVTVQRLRQSCTIHCPLYLNDLQAKRIPDEGSGRIFRATI